MAKRRMSKRERPVKAFTITGRPDCVTVVGVGPQVSVGPGFVRVVTETRVTEINRREQVRQFAKSDPLVVARRTAWQTLIPRAA
jgi:hypothetical protein